MSEMPSPQLTTDEELAVLARSGDERAADELYVRYIPMTEGAARRARIDGMEYDDLLSEAQLALRTAIGTFKPGRWWFVKWAELLVDRAMTNAWRRRPKLRVVSSECEEDLDRRAGGEVEAFDVQESIDAAAAEDLRLFGKGYGSEASARVFGAYRQWKGEPASLPLEAIDVFLLSRRFLRCRLAGTEARDVAPQMGIPRDLARAFTGLWAAAAVDAGLREAA